MAKKSNTITVNDTPISVVLSSDMNNYICITDMIRAQEGGDIVAPPPPPADLRPQRGRTSSLSHLQSVRTVRRNAHAHMSEGS